MRLAQAEHLSGFFPFSSVLSLPASSFMRVCVCVLWNIYTLAHRNTDTQTHHTAQHIHIKLARATYFHRRAKNVNVRRWIKHHHRRSLAVSYRACSLSFFLYADVRVRAFRNGPPTSRPIDQQNRTSARASSPPLHHSSPLLSQRCGVHSWSAFGCVHSFFLYFCIYANSNAATRINYANELPTQSAGLTAGLLALAFCGGNSDDVRDFPIKRNGGCIL